MDNEIKHVIGDESIPLTENHRQTAWMPHHDNPQVRHLDLYEWAEWWRARGVTFCVARRGDGMFAIYVEHECV